MNKSKLQEYLQKNNYPLPQYTTLRSGGQDHIPEFLSTVSVTKDGEELLFTPINRYPSTKKAEDAAAHLALESLKDTQQSVLPPRTLLLLDLENQGGALDTLARSYQLSKVTCHGFLSKNSGIAVENFNLTVHRTRCSRSDAADLALILFVGSMRPDLPTTILILTRDHFGDVLEELYKTGDLPYLSPNVYVRTFSSVKDLTLFLQA
jgi:hypothetical protein